MAHWCSKPLLVFSNRPLSGDFQDSCPWTLTAVWVSRLPKQTLSIDALCSSKKGAILKDENWRVILGRWFFCHFSYSWFEPGVALAQYFCQNVFPVQRWFEKQIWSSRNLSRFLVKICWTPIPMACWAASCSVVWRLPRVTNFCFRLLRLAALFDIHSLSIHFE